VRMKMMANAEPIAVRLQKISTGPNPETATRGTARGRHRLAHRCRRGASTPSPSADLRSGYQALDLIH
jgi:hypothetical protein